MSEREDRRIWSNCLQNLSIPIISEDFIKLFSYSTGLSLGNQVDGLPGALHTGAVWGVQGAFRPAPIYELDPRKLKIDRNCNIKLNQRFAQVLICILRLLLR